MLLKTDIKKLASINLILYSLLVVLTPFIMLQNYLQGFVRHLSGAQITVLGMSIPVVVLIFCGMLLVALFLVRRFITLKNMVAPVIALSCMAIGQSISDYYIDFKYYDLQNNWHYFAYFLFAFISWSYFNQKKAALSRILIYTALLGLSISIFDELFQNRLSQRIFDLSDVAKDFWGITIGLLVIVVLGAKKYADGKFRLRQENLKAYFINPVSCMFLIFTVALSFLIVSSLLTEKKYAGYVVLITILFVGVVFQVVHNFKGRKKKLLLFLGAVLLLGQLTLFMFNRNSDFIFHNNFLTVYRGWFMPFFDVMVYPDKTFRFVDKKMEFNNTDKQLIMKSQPDVILIGAGKYKEGGNGFPSKDNTHFILNPETQKPVQVIIMDSRNACMKYNELSQKGIKTVMVLNKSL